MTIGQQIRMDGFLIHLESSGRVITLKDGNKSFRALIADADTQDEQFLLGEDLREYARIEALRDEVPGDLKNADADSEVEAIQDDGQEILIVRRVDNPADVYIRFYAQKVIDGDNTPQDENE